MCFSNFSDFLEKDSYFSEQQVLCGCYADEGYPAINLLQSNPFDDGKKRTCLYFRFCDTFVQEAAYALWLDDQRKALFEKAAMYLEKYADKCRSCGGNGFIPGRGSGTATTSNEQQKLTNNTTITTNKRMSIAVSKNLRLGSMR